MCAQDVNLLGFFQSSPKFCNFRQKFSDKKTIFYSPKFRMLRGAIAFPAPSATISGHCIKQQHRALWLTDGASELELDEVEQRLNVKLPLALRCVYRIHDGQNNSTCPYGYLEEGSFLMKVGRLYFYARQQNQSINQSKNNHLQN